MRTTHDFTPARLVDADDSVFLTLDDKSIAFLCAPSGVEQAELLALWNAVARAGGAPRLISTAPGTVQCFDHLERANRIAVDAVVGSVSDGDFDALIIPGGIANGDALRTSSAAVEFTRTFVLGGKPVAAVGHGAWLLADADVLAGRTVTSTPSLQTDLVNAGAAWVDEPVVQCTNGPNALISGRGGESLDRLCEAVVNACAGADPLVAVSGDQTDGGSRRSLLPSNLLPSKLLPTSLWP